MVKRIQNIHYVLNQPVGLETTVYVQPQMKLILRCIAQYEKQLCGSSAKSETIATRNYVSKRAKILYLYAWNLEVTTSDALVIHVLQNPSSALQAINSGIFSNMLAQLEVIINPVIEQTAWNQTVQAMG